MLLAGRRNAAWLRTAVELAPLAPDPSGRLVQLELDLAFLERHCQLCLADEEACWRASPKTPGPGLCRQLALGPQEKAGSKAKMTWR